MGGRDDHLMYTGIVNVLRELGFLEGEVPDVPDPKVIGERYWLTAHQQGIFFPEVEICRDVAAGQRIGVVRACAPWQGASCLLRQTLRACRVALLHALVPPILPPSHEAPNTPFFSRFPVPESL